MNVLVTGASGFVGHALCQSLAAQGFSVRGAFRSPEKYGSSAGTFECCSVGDIGPDTNWQEALRGIDTVVHTAARAHIMRDGASDPLIEYRRVNAEGTARLATMAAQAGVRRFIFLSTVKVHGEENEGQCFSEQDMPAPVDPYAISKLEAEEQLQKLGAREKIEIVILRLPLVYGPGVKGNVLQLLDWVHQRRFLPVPDARNQRSLLYLGNLIDAIVTCLRVPLPANSLFLVSDGADVSTRELMTTLIQVSARPCLLILIPSFLLRWAGQAGNLLTRLVGKTFFINSAKVRRLTGSLAVDSKKIRSVTGWSPRYTLTDGLKVTVNWYQETKMPLALRKI